MFKKLPASKKRSKPLRSRGLSDDDDDPVDDDVGRRRGKETNTASRGAAGSQVGAMEDGEGAGAGGDNKNDDREGIGAVNRDSLLQTIAATKRKRKLLTDLQYKRGTDASQLLVSSATTARRGPPNGPGATSADELRDSVPGIGELSHVGLALSSAAATAEEPTTVLEKKHRQAMLEYVRQNLRQQASETVTATENNTSTVTSDAAETATPSLPTDLFSELASQANALQQPQQVAAAEHETAAALSVGGIGAPESSASTSTSTSVMLHGTGIVEVVLPTQARAQQTTELVEAAELKKRQQQQRHRNKRHRPGGDGKGDPAATVSSSRPVPHSLPSRPSASAGAVPSRFRTYQPPPATMMMMTATSAADRAKATTTRATTPATAANEGDVGHHVANHEHETSPSDVSERPGFAGFQRNVQHSTAAFNSSSRAGTTSAGTGSAASSSSSQHQQRQRASDHVVYKKFLTQQQKLPNKKW